MTITGFPSAVQARRILRIGPLNSDLGRLLEFDGGSHAIVNKKILAAYNPLVGDYYVIPSEGYAYIVPKATFAQTY
jgi:hypothetical protein